MIPEKATRSFMVEDYVVVAKHGQVHLKKQEPSPDSFGLCLGRLYLILKTRSGAGAE